MGLGNRRDDDLEVRLHEARREPSRALIDRVSADVGGLDRRVPRKLVSGVALGAVSALAVFALGGVGMAANTVTNAISPTPSAKTTSSACTVETPCNFTINATPNETKLDTSDTTKGNTQIHVGGGAPQPITITYSVADACGSGHSTAGITFSTSPNPVPADTKDQNFTVTTSNATRGIYTIAVTGTSGSKSSVSTFTIKVGGVTHC